jgi:hypothetical protein
MILKLRAYKYSQTHVVALFGWVLGASVGIAQQPPIAAAPAGPNALLQPATHVTAPQSVRFGQCRAQVGDEVEQTVSLEMRLAASVRQSNRLVAKEQTVMRGEQRRVVTTTDVAAGRPNAVTVRYLKASNQIAQSGGARQEVRATVQANSPALPQPVEGKTYHCRRDGGEMGKLLITDSDGNIPPSAEYEIVAENMEAVGRANPLADFLADRCVAVGETLELPHAAADRLFNLGERFGSVKRFELTLRKTLISDGMRCAMFAASIEAASSGSSQMRLQVEGPLIVQIDTCRAVRAELSGPIALSESRGTYSTAHQLIGTGNLAMRVASDYTRAIR